MSLFLGAALPLLATQLLSFSPRVISPADASRSLLMRSCVLQTVFEEKTESILPSSLYQAVRQGQTARVKELLLINQGINLLEVDHSGMNVLHYAAAHGSADIVKLLLDRGMAINSQDKIGRTPVLVASVFGNCAKPQDIPKFQETIRLFISRGADLNILDGFGQNLLHYAARFDHVMIQELIDTGVALNGYSELTGCTPLMTMVANGVETEGDRSSLFKVQLLLEAGADPSLRSRIPKHFQSTDNEKTVVSSPISGERAVGFEKVAIIFSANKNETAFDIARSQKKFELAKMLQQYEYPAVVRVLFYSCESPIFIVILIVLTLGGIYAIYMLNQLRR
jgi:ankyrin repeat protein